MRLAICPIGETRLDHDSNQVDQAGTGLTRGWEGSVGLFGGETAIVSLAGS